MMQRVKHVIRVLRISHGCHDTPYHTETDRKTPGPSLASGCQISALCRTERQLTLKKRVTCYQVYQHRYMPGRAKVGAGHWRKHGASRACCFGKMIETHGCVANIPTAAKKQAPAHTTYPYGATNNNRGRAYLGVATVLIVVHLVHFYHLQLLRTIHEVRHLGVRAYVRCAGSVPLHNATKQLD